MNHIAGIKDIASRYNAFFLDIFGVLHNGITPYPGTVQCLREMKAAGLKISLLSNTPKRGPYVMKDLASIGITPDLYDTIVTAGDGAHRALDNYQGQGCCFFGAGAFDPLLEGHDIQRVTHPEDSDFILNAVTSQYAFDHKAMADILSDAARKNIPMICANPDLVVHIGSTLYECAGTVAKIYEEVGGTVAYYGKPYEAVYEMAREALALSSSDKICAVGDALHTDVQGANRFGIDSVFNLVGIHWEDLQLNHQPGTADMNKVQTTIYQQPHRPTYTMSGFQWQETV